MFLQFLHTHMALEDIKFNGILINDSSEAWITCDHGAESIQDWELPPPTIGAEHCLQPRIARYVTHQGPFPFDPTFKHEDESETDRRRKEDSCKAFYDDHGLGWKWIQDESWYYEPDLLRDYYFD